MDVPGVGESMEAPILRDLCHFKEVGSKDKLTSKTSIDNCGGKKVGPKL